MVKVHVDQALRVEVRDVLCSTILFCLGWIKTAGNFLCSNKVYSHYVYTHVAHTCSLWADPKLFGFWVVSAVDQTCILILM